MTSDSLSLFIYFNPLVRWLWLSLLLFHTHTHIETFCISAEQTVIRQKWMTSHRLNSCTWTVSIVSHTLFWVFLWHSSHEMRKLKIPSAVLWHVSAAPNVCTCGSLGWSWLIRPGMHSVTLQTVDASTARSFKDSRHGNPNLWVFLPN